MASSMIRAVQCALVGVTSRSALQARLQPWAGVIGSQDSRALSEIECGATTPRQVSSWASFAASRATSDAGEELPDASVRTPVSAPLSSPHVLQQHTSLLASLHAKVCLRSGPRCVHAFNMLTTHCRVLTMT
jgi:hypothetical protein